jgi:hypothetical protein
MGLNYEYIFNVLRITTFLPSLKQIFSNVGYKKLAIIATILLNCFRRICSLGGVILFPRRGDMTNNFRVLIRPPCKSRKCRNCLWSVVFRVVTLCLSFVEGILQWTWQKKWFVKYNYNPDIIPVLTLRAESTFFS